MCFPLIMKKKLYVGCKYFCLYFFNIFMQQCSDKHKVKFLFCNTPPCKKGVLNFRHFSDKWLAYIAGGIVLWDECVFVSVEIKHWFSSLLNGKKKKLLKNNMHTDIWRFKKGISRVEMIALVSSMKCIQVSLHPPSKKLCEFVFPCATWPQHILKIHSESI